MINTWTRFTIHCKKCGEPALLKIRTPIGASVSLLEATNRSGSVAPAGVSWPDNPLPSFSRAESNVMILQRQLDDAQATIRLQRAFIMLFVASAIAFLCIAVGRGLAGWL